jgi:ribosomal protein L11 methyltransferase
MTNQTNITHRPAKTWHRVIITAPAERAEIISSFLASIPVDGVEQLAPPPDEIPLTTDKITAYLADTPNYGKQVNTIQNFIKQLNKQLPASDQCNCETEQVVEQDWNSNWKKHFKPFKLTKRIVIKPTWEPYSAQPGELIIEMDPGMAFGTGLHASTKLALSLVERLLCQDMPANILDVGTGTGILGMSCDLLGADNVLGLDNDIDARTAARDNITKNNLQSFVVSDNPLHKISGLYDLVIANITCDILFDLADDLASHLAPNGSLILSGILAGSQENEIKKIFSGYKFSVIHTEKMAEWVAIHFKSSKSHRA